MAAMNQNRNARVFFALWPDEAGRGALATWQMPLTKLCGGRAMCADTLHVTLVFIGDVAIHRLEALQFMAQEVRNGPFQLSLDAAHYWEHNHVVYAAPDKVPVQLLQLVRDLERGLIAHRFHVERRAYQPHVTLLRHAGWNNAPFPAMPAVTWRMQEFVLVQSLRGENGAHYAVLAKFPLLGG